MATPHNLARAICKKVFRQKEAQKRRNTLCISSFTTNLWQKFRKAPQTILCGVAFINRGAFQFAFWHIFHLDKTRYFRLDYK